MFPPIQWQYTIKYSENIFLWHEVFFVLLVTGNLFPVKGNLYPVKGNLFPVTGNKFPMTGDKFPVAGNKFLWQEIHFPWKEINFPWHEINFLWQEINCYVTRMVFLVRENSFLMNFWSSFRCITFSWQMCGIYNQNFVWDHKISWEPGSHVPPDSPTLLVGDHPRIDRWLSKE